MTTTTPATATSPEVRPARVTTAASLSVLIPDAEIIDCPEYEQTVVGWDLTAEGGGVGHFTVSDEGRVTFTAEGAPVHAVRAFLHAITADQDPTP